MTGTPLADLLAAAGTDWVIGRNEQLHLWTAERRDGTAIHYIVAGSARELESKIRRAGQEDPGE